MWAHNSPPPLAGTSLPEDRSDKVATGTGMTGSEDFSAFAEKVPSVYLILGGGTAEEGYPYANHHPAFRPDEGCFMAGVRIEAAMALDFLMRP